MHAVRAAPAILTNFVLHQEPATYTTRPSAPLERVLSATWHSCWTSSVHTRRRSHASRCRSLPTWRPRSASCWAPRRASCTRSSPRRWAPTRPSRRTWCSAPPCAACLHLVSILQPSYCLTPPLLLPSRLSPISPSPPSCPLLVPCARLHRQVLEDVGCIINLRNPFAIHPWACDTGSLVPAAH